MTDIDWSDCPIVERDPEKMGGEPTVRAWRVTADAVVGNYDYGIPPEEIAEMFTLPIDDVLAVLAYAKEVRHGHHAHSV